MSMSNKRIDVDPLTDEELGEIRRAYRVSKGIKLIDLSKHFKRQGKIISVIVGTKKTAHEVMMQLSGKYAEANKNKPLVQTELPINFPPLRDDLRDFEKQSGFSIDVLVNVQGCSFISIGRYLHGVEEWQVNGFNNTGFAKVAEWWPLPALGTGTKV